MGFQILLAVASDAGYTLYRRSVPMLLDFPREQISGLTRDATPVATGVSREALMTHIDWRTDTALYVLGETDSLRALVVAVDIGDPTPTGLLVEPQRGDSLRRLHIRSQGARETAAVLHQDHGVAVPVVRAGVETVLASWGGLSSGGQPEWFIMPEVVQADSDNDRSVTVTRTSTHAHRHRSRGRCVRHGRR